MIPVYQTKFVKLDPNDSGTMRVKGNCYAACIASLLEIPIEQVPAFEELPPDGSWFYKTQEFLAARGLTLEVYYKGELCPGYSIGSIPSPRGPWSHAVICLDGKIIHDPFTTGQEKNNERMEKFDYFIKIVKL